MKNNWWYRARAPLRLSFGGGGTDIYPYVRQHGGAILSGTIDRYVYAMLKPLRDEVVFTSLDKGLEERLPLQQSYPNGDGDLALHRAIYNRIVSEHNGGEPLPVHFCTFSDVPAGTGLGSSSTLAVAGVRCFESYLGAGLSVYELADLAHRIERHDLGLLGGYQDQYAAAFGGFNLMEFFTDKRVLVNPLRISRDIQVELESSMLLYFTGVSREGAQIIQAQSAALEKEGAAVQGMHRIKELAHQMKAQLLTGQIRELADTLDQSWMLKRETAREVSSSAIDDLYRRARAAGAWGGKISGAGGGGFMMLLCDPMDRLKILGELPESPNQNHFCHFTDEGAHAWRARH